MLIFLNVELFQDESVHETADVTSGAGELEVSDTNHASLSAAVPGSASALPPAGGSASSE